MRSPTNPSPGFLLASLSLLLLVLLSLPSPSSSGVPHGHGQHGHVHGGGGKRERESDGAFSPRDRGHGHQGGGEHHHDSSFDHEAILGSTKDAEEFDELPPEEAKKRLGELLPKMDRNGDDKVDKRELEQWILRSFRSLAAEESAERFDESDSDEDGQVAWEEYRKEEFDLDDDELDENVDDEDREEEYSMMQEDKMLFAAADKDSDGKLTKQEFLSFTHPEEDPAMHDVVIQQVRNR